MDQALRQMVPDRSSTEHGEVIPTRVLQMRLEFVREDEEWRGECLELAVATSCAPSLEQDREEMMDLTQLFLEGNNKRG